MLTSNYFSPKILAAPGGRRVWLLSAILGHHNTLGSTSRLIACDLASLRSVSVNVKKVLPSHTIYVL